jgi:hypothetical protein
MPRFWSALNAAPAPGRHFAVNRNTVVDANAWPGRRTTVGKFGLFGESGKCCVSRQKPPLTIKTRIYSCILVNNALTFRWRGKYNEDTDLSLRVLKAGWCTILFNAFLAKKITTMKMKGGNTDELYRGDGRLKMAQSLRRQHPDVVRIAWRWGRWQHQVDYRPFARNRLIRRPDVQVAGGVNDYGMVLRAQESAAGPPAAAASTSTGSAHQR